MSPANRRQCGRQSESLLGAAREAVPRNHPRAPGHLLAEVRQSEAVTAWVWLLVLLLVGGTASLVLGQVLGLCQAETASGSVMGLRLAAVEQGARDHRALAVQVLVTVPAAQ